MNQITIILLLAFWTNIIAGQKTDNYRPCEKIEGVYLSEDNYIKNIFSDSICSGFGNNQLVITFGVGIKLKENHENRTYSFREVYGYFTNGEKYRNAKVTGAYNYKGAFKVVATDGLIIYTQKKIGHNFYRYFYSQGKTGKIKFLIMRNLKKDFSDKQQFLYKALNSKKELHHKNKEGIYLINELWNKYGEKP